MGSEYLGCIAIKALGCWHLLSAMVDLHLPHFVVGIPVSVKVVGYATRRCKLGCRYCPRNCCCARYAVGVSQETLWFKWFPVWLGNVDTDPCVNLNR